MAGVQGIDSASSFDGSIVDDGLSATKGGGAIKLTAVTGSIGSRSAYVHLEPGYSSLTRSARGGVYIR
jgi:hypothetical protein